MRRAIAILAILTLGAISRAPQAGQYCTHARVVMRHACCPPGGTPDAPRLLCCTPVGQDDVVAATTVTEEGVRPALVTGPPASIPPRAWTPVLMAPRRGASSLRQAEGPPVPLRV